MTTSRAWSTGDQLKIRTCRGRSTIRKKNPWEAWVEWEFLVDLGDVSGGPLPIGLNGQFVSCQLLDAFLFFMWACAHAWGNLIPVVLRIPSKYGFFKKKWLKQYLKPAFTFGYRVGYVGCTNCNSNNHLSDSLLHLPQWHLGRTYVPTYHFNNTGQMGDSCVR